MPALLIVIIAIIVGFLIFFVARRGGGSQGVWVQFFMRGKDEGFTFKEIELLRKLAVKSNLADPASLYWSLNQLDICIRSLVNSVRISGEDQDQSTQDFLSKLYDFRKKIEMEKSPVKGGISGSREMINAQPLRVNLQNVGVFKSQVVGNSTPFLTISRPENDRIPYNLPWIGQRISVYFWREDDAGYVFDTDVLEELQVKGKAAIRVAHAAALYRTQKRKSVRVKIHKAAFLYSLSAQDEAEPGKLETAPGLKCFIEDISDSGCAITIGGKAASGMRVKVQFTLDNAPVSMSGTVRSAEYKGSEVNQSLLHIEADPLPPEVRNRILGEVFGVLPEDEEALPFRLLDEEVETITGQSNSHDNTV